MEQQRSQSLSLPLGVDCECAEMQLVDHVPGTEVAEDPVLVVGEHVEDADWRVHQLSGEVPPTPSRLAEGAAVELNHDVNVFESHRPQLKLIVHIQWGCRLGGVCVRVGSASRSTASLEGEHYTAAKL